MILLWALLAQGEGCPALLDRGRKAYEAREFVRAVAEFERALPVCRNRGQVLLALGQAQLLAQRIEASIATLREATALEPHDAMGHKLLGDALYLSGQEIEAEKFFKAALAIDSRHEATLYALGRVYYQQKRFPEAVRQFQKVLEENPESYRAHDNLALCYDALRQDSDALRHFFKALDLVHKDHPDYDWAYANLADFYLRRDQYEKAFHLAAEAAHRNPESARNCFLTGKALIRLDKQELSLRWLQQAVRLDPSYAEARYLLAQAYRKLGREEEALRELQKFRELREEPRPRR